MFYSNVPTDFHHKKMHLQWEGIEGCVKVKKCVPPGVCEKSQGVRQILFTF